ncbi:MULTISPECIES: DUF4255 domain-containing protein [unclassified Saccharopolyspora]|uniref:DUF4255 domain-containing protein n=1 Tax=unclassified Saccharopolyspora TaxID=2646250 RepID=UPI001CD4786E|nr:MULTISPECIES: DUF4255 domain-containing protein [unclassified Saccharopolyspora]MCA1195171.1 DUF4255 domain-containing protein [Saccharopolyspora sp. 6V]MCA1228022.1 DUF4255 domain-containing protein [Saccharopolyspora sp. 6M]
MIHEVDEGLRLLLAEEGLPGSGVELAFDPPTTDWAAKRNAPTVNVFLYDLREEPALRRSGAVDRFDESGEVVGRFDPPRWFQLSYLVTAWTNRPQDEHRLLAQALRGLIRYEALDPRWRTGSLGELGLEVSLETGGELAENRSPTDVWSALGGELKPSIPLRVTAPLAGVLRPVGPPVTEGVALRGRASFPEGPADEQRHLRYDGTAAEGDGFSSPKPRPQGRRRLRGPL